MIKKLVYNLLAFSVLCRSVFAGCDFSKDIVENKDGSYTYSRACHIQVGKDQYSLSEYKLALDGRKKEIELKDLALQKQEERVVFWMDKAHTMSTKVTTYEDMRSTNQLLYFGAGVVLTGLAVWGAGQLRR